MEPTADILESIRKIVRALRVSSRAAEKELGLSGAQLFVLQKLKGGETLSINELARRTLTHQSSVSVVVTRLFDQGLVLRRHAKTDARRVDVCLSGKGRALLRKAPVTPQERLIEAIASLPVPHQVRLAKSLGEVVEASGFSEGPAPLFFEEDERLEGRKKATAGRSNVKKTVGKIDNSRRFASDDRARSGS